VNPLEVLLLGTPAVRLGGQFLVIPRRRVRALLFRLAVELQPVSREHLATLFWSRISDATAHRDLSHLITHLRGALPQGDYLEVESDFVCLNPAVVSSDTSQFMGLFHQSHEPPTDCDAPMPATHPGHMPALLQAAELYRGPLMDGFFLDEGLEYDEWLSLERCVWERRFQMLFDALERSGAPQSHLALHMRHVRYMLEEESFEQRPEGQPQSNRNHR
jgi:hypothetical protein